MATTPFGEAVPTTTVAQLPTNAIVPAGWKVVDVREQDEWDDGHIPGALHIPLGELADRLGELPEDDTLLLVCRSGGRSERAAQWLMTNGFEAINLVGGMSAWHNAGRPMAAAGGSEPTVR